MRAVIQRVNRASVSIESKEVAKIGKGLVILLGVVKGDGSSEVKSLAQKILELRIFSDEQRKMNLSSAEVNAEVIVVSQFTLCANLDRGRRPSFDNAAEPQVAEKLYLEFVSYLRKAQLKVEQGVFKAYMAVHIENDGPVTFTLDTKKD